MAFMTGGNVKLSEQLRDPIAGIASKRKASLESTLGRVQARSRAGQEATGRPMGEYTAQELGRAGDLSSRGVEDTLLGVIGGSSYKDVINQQEHERKMDLARRIGRAYNPKMGQEILQGIGLAGQVLPSVIGAGKSAYGYLTREPAAPPFGSWANPYGSSDLEAILGRMRGYDEYPNMLRAR